MQKAEKDYSELKVLGFDHRSAKDQELALQRPALKEAHERDVTAIQRQLRLGDNPFSVDNRLITSDPLYRRLSGMGQIAPTFSPGFQNRLTHTQHVARISARIADCMQLGDRSHVLVRSIAHAHDIGHAPFSHEGETVFKEEMKKYGSFWDHDQFGTRILTRFAHGGISYDGIPVTNATMEGLVKRFKRYHSALDKVTLFDRPTTELHSSILQLEKRDGAFHLNKWSPIEGQIGATSDWIAGIVSDTRDMLTEALHTKSPKEFEQYCNELVKEFPPAKQLWAKLQQEVKEIVATTPNQQGLERSPYYSHMQSTINLFTNELEGYLVQDVLDHSLQTYRKYKDQIKNAEDVRDLPELLVEFTPATFQLVQKYDAYFHQSVYPKLLERGANTVYLMRSFFTLVKGQFENPQRKDLKIDPSWREIYDRIKGDNTLDTNEKAKQLTDTVCGYITCNYSDRDVLYFIRNHDPKLYKKEITDKNYQLYPTYSHPKSPQRYMNLISSERECGTGQGHSLAV